MVAEIPGLVCWKLSKKGSRFFNFHKMSKTLRTIILEWGASEGLTRPLQTYVLHYVDKDEWRYSVFNDRKKAEADLKYYIEEEGVEANLEVRASDVRSTSRLEDLSHAAGPLIGADVVIDYLTILYAEEVADLDGVWWNDRFDPDNLSLPRGAIFNSKLSTWSKEQIEYPRDD